MKAEATDAAMAALGKNMAVGGGGSAVIGGLAIGDIAAIVGAVVAVIGLYIQWHYKRKSDRREAELHDARMKDPHGAAD